MFFRTVEDQEVFSLLEQQGEFSLQEARENYFTRKSPFWNSARQLLKSFRAQHAWRKYRAKYEIGIRRFFHSYKGLSARRYLNRELKKELNQQNESFSPESCGYRRQELLLYLGRFASDLLQESLAFQQNDSELVETWEVSNGLVEALLEAMQSILQETGTLSTETKELLLLLLDKSNEENQNEHDTGNEGHVESS